MKKGRWFQAGSGGMTRPRTGHGREGERGEGLPHLRLEVKKTGCCEADLGKRASSISTTRERNRIFLTCSWQAEEERRRRRGREAGGRKGSVRRGKEERWPFTPTLSPERG